MKTRIGDITLEQFYKICNEHPVCDGCPLRSRTMCLSDEYDIEVEIPDHMLSAAKKKTEEAEKWDIHSKDEALQMIIALADDYDNANSVEGLKNLIDELVEVAKAGMTK